MLGVLLVVPIPCGTAGTGTRILTGAGGFFLLAGQRGDRTVSLRRCFVGPSQCCHTWMSGQGAATPLLDLLRFWYESGPAWRRGSCFLGL